MDSDVVKRVNAAVQEGRILATRRQYWLTELSAVNIDRRARAESAFASLAPGLPLASPEAWVC